MCIDSIFESFSYRFPDPISLKLYNGVVLVNVADAAEYLYSQSVKPVST